MRFHKSLIALLLCLSLFVVVSAHPGKTDYKGGHIDHSTEEYHYHHGYSAHQHYDMDGDGDLDCPYSFDDKTESSKNDAGPAKGGSVKKVKNYFLPIICCLALYGVVLLVDEIRWRFKK